MSWLDMLTMTVDGLATVECVAGRLAAMHWSEHRPSLLLGYLAATGVCITAAYQLWQGLDARWLDLAAWGIAAHLALSWRHWRHGAPASAFRDDTGGMVPVHAENRHDDGGR